MRLTCSHRFPRNDTTDLYLARAQERQEFVQEELRADAVLPGQRQARRPLLKIDPKEVQVHFDPVDYIVFHDLRNLCITSEG
jgi:hypothetical protein